MQESPPSSEIILYQTEDGRNKIEVRLENETVWLTQQLMAELFQTTQQNISLHIQNIYAEGELRPEATHKDFLSVRREGSRDVQRRLEHYNLATGMTAAEIVRRRADATQANMGLTAQYIEDLKSAALILEAGQKKVPSKQKGGQR